MLMIQLQYIVSDRAVEVAVSLLKVETQPTKNYSFRFHLV